MNTGLLTRAKRYFIIICLVLLVGGVAYFGHSIFSQGVQASEQLEPTVTTGQFIGRTADDLRISIAHDQVDLDNLKSELNKKEKLISDKSESLERVRCQDDGLAITDYCKNMNGLGK